MRAIKKVNISSQCNDLSRTSPNAKKSLEPRYILKTVSPVCVVSSLWHPTNKYMLTGLCTPSLLHLIYNILLRDKVVRLSAMEDARV